MAGKVPALHAALLRRGLNITTPGRSGSLLGTRWGPIGPVGVLTKPTKALWQGTRLRGCVARKKLFLRPCLAECGSAKHTSTTAEARQHQGRRPFGTLGFGTRCRNVTASAGHAASSSPIAPFTTAKSPESRSVTPLRRIDGA